MTSPARLCALALLAALVAAPAGAVEQKAARPAAARKAPERKGQERKTPEGKATEPQAPAPAAPPYEPQMLRLAEIMGALAYLRDLCGDGDGAEYRARMSALLDAEGREPERREKLAGAYNRGYSGYAANYGVCTPNARLAIDRFVKEGGRIARDISYHFGGT